jgi:hypothetical protein
VSSAKVVKYEMNKALQPRAFEIEFPVGTLVADHKTGDSYLLKDGGEKRRILAGEFSGDNYKELLTTAPGEAGGRRSSPRGALNVWFIAVNVIVILILLLLVAGKSLRRLSTR